MDLLSHNKTQVAKLDLPFALLSDPKGELTKLCSLWNAEEGVAVPSIVVVRTAGSPYATSTRAPTSPPGPASIDTEKVFATSSPGLAASTAASTLDLSSFEYGFIPGGYHTEQLLR